MAEETLQLLKREEVRTMAKDIALLRKEEAKKERDRIVSLRETPRLASRDLAKPESVKKTEPAEPATASKPSLMPHAETQKPVFVRAKTRPEKILIRVIVIGVLLFVLLNGLAFGYWYFTKKKAIEITPAPTQVEEDGNQVSAGNLVSQPQPKPEPTPVLFFGTVQEKTIDLGATDSLITFLSGALAEEYPQGFTRILLKNTENSAFLTTREFLDRAAVAMPGSLLSLLKEDFMLFVYSSPGRKRLGFIAELVQAEGTEQQRSNALRSWETTIEQDTKSLWEITGQKGSAYTSFFRQAVYQNNLVRFQTFSVMDFGIVYALFGTKLILTTSFESLTKAVDQIIQSEQ